MTDQWVPGPPPVPTPPITGLPPANSWNAAAPCSTGPNQPSIVDGVVITGVPATIVSPYAWAITLNDGGTPANFTIDHYNASGVLIESPIAIDGTSGDVLLTHDPTQPLGAATKGYLDAEIAAIGGIPEAPIDLNVYGRGNASWRVVPPEAPIDGSLYARAVLAWQRVPIQADAPSDGATYGRSNGGWGPVTIGGPYMPLSGGTFGGIVTFNANNSLVINGAPGSQRAILTGTSGSWRWQLIMGDSTAESGANAGSNFVINSLSDSGAMVCTPLSINRATGAVTIASTSGIGAQAPTLALNAATTAPGNIVQGQRNGSPRWTMYLGNVNAELGGNLGSNFQLMSFDDSGAILASPLLISRQTGQATFSQLPSFPGGVLNYVLATNGAGVLAWAPPGGASPSTIPPLMNGAAAVGTGTNYSREDHVHPSDTSRYAASNPSGYQTAAQVTAAVPVASTTAPIMNGTAAIGTGTTWARADHVHPVDTSRYAASNPSGYQTAAQVTAVLPVASTTAPIMNGAAAPGSSAAWSRGDHVHPTDTTRAAASALASYLPLAGGTMTGVLNVSTALNINNAGAGGGINLATSSGQPGYTITNPAYVPLGEFYYNVTSGDTGIYQVASGGVAYVDAGGAFNISGATANKPGGGTWTAASDERIKTVEADYQPGLAEVLALRPVVYTYKGNDSFTENGPSVHASVAEQGRRFVGLIAQEVEEIFPDMVTKREGWIDGEKVDDFRNLDTTELIFALVNAVKDLKAEIVQLRADAGLA